MTLREFEFMPARIAALPRDERGFPIPRFVEWFDGKPDFRVVSTAHFSRCLRHGSCWICGERLGSNKVFTIGPMCVCNRVSAEPPAHYECALFAAKYCPFLSKPLARRRDTSDIPGGVVSAGMMIERNPGVCALWVTRSFKPFGDGGGGILVTIGPPDRIEFYAQGRPAERAEIEESIASGLPILEAAAREEGTAALRELQRRKAELAALVEEFA